MKHVYIPNMNLTKFEPLKPSRSGDISLLVLKCPKKLWSSHIVCPKYVFHHQNTRTSCVQVF